jgi:outer membrane protein OmpA-like peptidoglycan-associated protein
VSVDKSARACPELVAERERVGSDFDGDGIDDASDRCPCRPETHQGIDDADGCPDIPGSPTPSCETILRAVSLRDVDFQAGEHQLDDRDKLVIDRVIRFLRDELDTSIVIAGHGDDREPARDRQRLSELRAESVRQYMIDQGIDGDRIDIEGFADRFPIDPSDDTKARASNRRVEVHSIIDPLCPELAEGRGSTEERQLSENASEARLPPRRRIPRARTEPCVPRT